MTSTKADGDVPQTDAWSGEVALERGIDAGVGFSRVSALSESLLVFLVAASGLDAGGRIGIRLLCDELGSNVVRHVAPRRPVRLRFEAEILPGSVRVRVADDGEEFDPFARGFPEPPPDPDGEGMGGLGLRLIRRLFPEGRHRRRDGWNVVEVERADRR